MNNKDYKMGIKSAMISGVVLALLIVTSGCSSMDKPNIEKDYISLSAIEKSMLFNIDSCFYAQQFTKVDLRCSDILKENSKVKNILNFNLLKKENQLPTLYDQNGEHTMTFDGFFKLMK